MLISLQTHVFSSYIHELSHIEDDYIPSWFVVGPFPSGNLDIDYFAAEMEGGEKALSEKYIAPESHVNFQGSDLYFRERNSSGNVLDLINSVGNSPGAVAYAYCALVLDEEKYVDLGIGIDGAFVLWVNGIEVLRKRIPQKLTLDSNLVENFPLKKGQNFIVAKVLRDSSTFVFDAGESVANLGEKPWSFTLRILPKGRAHKISGTVSDSFEMKVTEALVKLEDQNGEIISQTETNNSGNFQFVVYPPRRHYDLNVTSGKDGASLVNINPETNIQLKLSPSISIQGKLMTLDNLTPHDSVVVEAVNNQSKIFRTLSDDQGNYEFVNLKPGRYQVRVQTPIGPILYESGERLNVRPEQTISGVDLDFAPLKKGHWQQYTSLEGLPSHNINSMLVSQDGSLWIATDNGVSHYDGNRFQNFTQTDGLSHSKVWSICSNEKSKGLQPDGTGGDIWFGTDNGLTRYDGKAFKAYRFSKSQQTGITGNSVRVVFRSDNEMIWVGTNQGLTRMDPIRNKFQPYRASDRQAGVGAIPDDYINAISQTTDGSIWVGTLGGVAQIKDNRVVRTLTTIDGLPDNRVLSIENDGNFLWIGTRGGAAYFDGKNISKVLTVEDGLVNNRVTSIHRDVDGVIWFGTTQWFGWNQDSNTSLTGISRYQDDYLITFSGMLITDITSTMDGLIWFATESDGLFSYDEKGIINYDSKDGLTGVDISTIFEASNGDIWFGTWDRGGAIKYDGNNFLTTSVEDGLIGNGIVSSFSQDSSSNILIGTGGPTSGIQIYDDSSQQGKFLDTYTPRLMGSTFWGVGVNSILAVPNGIFWMGTWEDGLIKFENGFFRRYTRNSHGLIDDRVFSVIEGDDNSVWIATRNGVAQFKNGTVINKIDITNGLLNNLVNSISIDNKGNLWIAGKESGGVAKYNKNSKPQIENYTVRTTLGQLSSDSVNLVYHTPDGRIWFGTAGSGISIYDPKENLWAQLSTKDGLAGNYIQAIHRTTDGTVWIGTTTGITRYNPSKVASKAKIISYQSTSDQTPQNIGLLQTANFKLRAKRRVTFNYGAIDFKVPIENRRYRCRLIKDGKTADWGTITKSTSFDYSFPSSGRYFFEVQFVNPELNYSESEVLAFDIAPPPFYQHEIFYIFVSLIVLGAGGFAAVQTRQALINQAAIREYQKLAVQELEDAQNIQMSLMPQDPPNISGLDFYGTSQPMGDVGGDFFDYIITQEDQEIAIAVADVSGKMMQGAMNAVMTDGILQLATNEADDPKPEAIISKVNDILARRFQRDTNVTMVFGLLNTLQKTFTFCNAGHHAHPILLRDGHMQQLEHFGFPLGMKYPMNYKSRTVKLQENDLMLVFTDGVIEPLNEEGKMYSETDRLESVILGLPKGASPETAVNCLIADVLDHASDAEKQGGDDITVVGIRITS